MTDPHDPGPMPEPRVIDFKSEASMWGYLERGEKFWEARRYDLNDGRFVGLATPDDDVVVRFINKATHQMLAFNRVHYFFLDEFMPGHGRGWVVMYLGDRRHEYESYRNTGCDACRLIRMDDWDTRYRVSCPAHTVRCGLHFPEGGFCPERLSSPTGHSCD